MAEKKVFKNPERFWIGDDYSARSPHKRVAVEDETGISYFPNAEWDVEITLTRKVKPIPHDTLVEHTASAGYYLKADGRWLFLGYFVEEGKGVPAVNQNDEWYYKNTKPLKAGEWD